MPSYFVLRSSIAEIINDDMIATTNTQIAKPMGTQIGENTHTHAQSIKSNALNNKSTKVNITQNMLPPLT